MKIGNIEEFHSPGCYDLYLYAIEYANQINTLLDKGYWIYDGNTRIQGRFVFYGINKPGIAIRYGNFLNTIIGYTYDSNWKVKLMGVESKTSIKKKFSQFRYVRPKNIEKIKFDIKEAKNG